MADKPIRQSQTIAEKSIRVATLSDVPQMAECFATSFYNDDVFGRFMHPHRAEFPEDWRQHWLKEMRSNVVKPSSIPYVRVNASGKIKGCCIMKRLGPGGQKLAATETLGRKAERALVSAQEKIEEYTWTDRSADPEAMAIFERNWEDIKHHYTGPREDCWMVDLLCVHSDSQGKGYGKELMLNAIEHAKDENVPLALISSDTADDFYEKLGLREAGRANIGDMTGCLGGSIKFYEEHLKK